MSERGYADSVVNGQTIDREVEICQIGLQGLGKCRMKRSLTGRSNSIWQSMEAWNYRVHLGNGKFADMAGI